MGAGGAAPRHPLERWECTLSRMEVIANAIIFFSGAYTEAAVYGFGFGCAWAGYGFGCSV